MESKSSVGPETKNDVCSLCIKAKLGRPLRYFEIRGVCYGLCLDDRYLWLEDRQRGSTETDLLGINADCMHAAPSSPRLTRMMPRCPSGIPFPIQSPLLKPADVGRGHGMVSLGLGCM